MVSNLFKILLSITTASGCIYSMQVFGSNTVLLAVLAAPAVILTSIFYSPLQALAKALGSGIGVLSLLALILLLLAGTTGGSFNLSSSNEVIAIFLVFTTLFGLTSFFWPAPLNESV